MAGGAPRTVSFSVEEMEILGQEMVDWVVLNKPIHLCEWYTILKKYTYKEWKAFIQRPEFLPYYEQALKLTGLQYLKKGEIEPGIANRFVRIYFADLRDEENETKKMNAVIEAEAKKAIEDRRAIPPGDADITDKLSSIRLSFENGKLKQELEELKAKFESKSKTDPELQRSE